MKAAILRSTPSIDLDNSCISIIINLFVLFSGTFLLGNTGPPLVGMILRTPSPGQKVYTPHPTPDLRPCARGIVV